MLKENKIKLKVFEHAIKKYQNLRDFIEGRILQKRINNENKNGKKIFQGKDQNSSKIGQIEKPQSKKTRGLSMNKKDFDEVIMDSDNSKQKNFVSKNLIKDFQQKNRKLTCQSLSNNTTQSQNYVNNHPFNNIKIFEINICNDQGKSYQNSN